MIESELGALFNRIADEEPTMSQIDAPQAHRRGRAQLRWRRVGLGGTPVLAAAVAVVAALTVGAAPAPRTPSSVTGPAAPREFSPLVPYLSFGWLPPGIKLVDGDILKQVVSLDADRKLFGTHDFGLSVYAAGQCHLTTGATGAKTLTCAPKVYDITDKIDSRAPSVDGHQAFWSGYELVWQYARGGWATLSVPFKPVPFKPIPKRAPLLKRQAVKVASNVRYAAATPPLKFPVQLSGLPSQWQVSSVFYVPNHGVLQSYRFALSSGTPDPGADGGLEYQKGLPYFGDFTASTPKSSCPRYTFRKGFSDKSKVETINGFRVVLTTLPRGKGIFYSQVACTTHARGLDFSIDVQGRNPPENPATLFRDHLKVLGANPADWTTKPVS